MKASFLPGSKIDRRLLAAMLAIAVVCFVGLGALVAACGGAETTSTVASATLTTGAVTTTESVTTTRSVITTTTEAPTTTSETLAPMTAAQISQWNKDATAFADGFAGAFPADVDAMLADFADDAAFWDPSDGDFLIGGKPGILTMQRDFNEYFANGEQIPKAVYVSGNAVAFPSTFKNMWPPWVPEPTDHPWGVDLEVFRFRDGQVAGWDIWFSAPTLEMYGQGVFAPGKGGPQQLQEIVDRYLAAWASGDGGRIAALYHPDASFSDTVLGLQAQGAAAIAALGEKRFGSGAPVTLEVIDLCAQTNGKYPPYEQKPKDGAIIGVGIHYHCNLVVEGKPTIVESLTTFELGTRMGKYFEPDPNGLITREEVFHDADSLLASGLVR